MTVKPGAQAPGEAAKKNQAAERRSRAAINPLFMTTLTPNSNAVKTLPHSVNGTIVFNALGASREGE